MSHFCGNKKTDVAPAHWDAPISEQHSEDEITLPADELRDIPEAGLTNCSDDFRVLTDAEIPDPPPPPPYLAQEIKARLRYEDPEVRRRAHRRMIGSPHFIASCAIILAGVIVTLGAIVHMNNSEPRSDYWVPAIVVSAGHAVILLADSDDPMREMSTDEINARLRRELYHDSNTGLVDQSTIARAEAMRRTEPIKRPAEGR